MTIATYNRFTLPPPHAYDALRRQYPDLFRYASEGARYYDQLMAFDQDALDLLARVARVLWLIVDQFFAATQATLPVDALVGLAQLRLAWRSLHLAAIARIARPAPQSVTLAMSGTGATLLAAIERDIAAAVTLSGHAWLLRGTQLLLALSETGG